MKSPFPVLLKQTELITVRRLVESVSIFIHFSTLVLYFCLHHIIGNKTFSPDFLGCLKLNFQKRCNSWLLDWPVVYISNCDVLLNIFNTDPLLFRSISCILLIEMAFLGLEFLFVLCNNFHLKCAIIYPQYCWQWEKQKRSPIVSELV